MRPSRRLLLVWLALHAPIGVMAAGWPPGWPISQREQAINVVLGLGTTIVTYAWCRLEAAERGRAVPGRSALWAGLFPPVGLPLYLWRTRGKAAWRAAAWALGYFVATLLLVSGVEVALAR